MKYSSIRLGENVEIDPSSSFNNVYFEANVRIAKRCSIFGGPDNILIIGANSYIGMNSILNGYKAILQIGSFVSIAQSVNIMVDSGPNASPELQKIFPIHVGPVKIGDHCWIGADSIIMPDVILGDFCVVAANSFVNRSFPPYSIIGGNPARLIRTFTKEEVKKIRSKC
jgi:acetyltransferase-like isoleucine patch superfamily enzyme